MGSRRSAPPSSRPAPEAEGFRGLSYSKQSGYSMIKTKNKGFETRLPQFKNYAGNRPIILEQTA